MSAKIENYKFRCVKLVSYIKENHRVKVFENRVLRNIFGPKKEEVTGGWTKLNYENLHNLYPHQILFGSFNQGR
jgi:hypothetical protein